MNIKTLFRVCVVVGAAYPIAHILLDDSPPAAILSEADKLCKLSPQSLRELGQIADFTCRTCVLFLVGYFGSLVGLFFFWSPARILFVVSLVTPVLVFPLAWWELNSAWAIIMACIESLFCAGFVVAMYVSPVKKYFGSRTGDQ